MGGSEREALLPPEAAREVELSGWRGRVNRAENLLVVVPLMIMAVVPVMEIVLRRFHTGISGSTSLVQHCTLLVGMFGGLYASAVLCSLSHRIGNLTWVSSAKALSLSSPTSAGSSTLMAMIARSPPN